MGRFFVPILQVTGAPFPEEFRFHLYGAYSSDLRVELDAFAAEELIEEKPANGKNYISACTFLCGLNPWPSPGLLCLRFSHCSTAVCGKVGRRMGIRSLGSWGLENPRSTEFKS